MTILKMKFLLLMIYLRYSAKVDASNFKLKLTHKYVLPSLRIWVLTYGSRSSTFPVSVFQELEVNDKFRQNKCRVFRDVLLFRGVKGVITSQSYHRILTDKIYQTKNEKYYHI